MVGSAPSAAAETLVNARPDQGHRGTTMCADTAELGETVSVARFLASRVASNPTGVTVVAAGTGM